MRIFLKYISLIFILTSLFGFFSAFTDIGKDYWEKEETSLDNICIVSALIQVFIYTLYFFFNVFYGIKIHYKRSILFIKIFSYAILLFLFLLFWFIPIANRKTDSLALCYIYLSAIWINYLVLSLMTADKIISPAKLFKFFID